jgi:hypothetical protein
MVTIVSKVRCLLRIDSNIGRRKVDAPRGIFNEKEEEALRKGTDSQPGDKLRRGRAAGDA